MRYIAWDRCNLLLLLFICHLTHCYHDAMIGGECRYDDDCFTDHSFCYQHEVCSCKEGFIESDDLQYCIATVGGICRSRHDCSETLDNSLCVEERCTCMDGYVPNSLENACVRVALSVGDICQDDIQCQITLGDFSRCLNGQCLCMPGHHFTSGKCFRSNELFKPCKRWEDCYIGREYNHSIHCMDGICQCRNGYHHTTDNKCKQNSASKTNDDIFTFIFVLFTVYFVVFN